MVARTKRVKLSGAVNATVTVARGRPSVVGRATDANVVIPDPRVSRFHCLLDIGSQGQLEVCDLGSQAGTQVNGARVERGPLRPGDELKIADNVVRIDSVIDVDEATADALPAHDHPEENLDDSAALLGVEYRCVRCGRQISLETFADGNVVERDGRFVCPRCADDGPPPEEEPGTTVETRARRALAQSGFHVVERIDLGGPVPVFRATRAELDQEVVVKALPLDEVGSRREARLLQEARLAARLQHPNIVRLYDVRRVPGLVFLVMESLRGKTLLRVIEEKRALDAKSTLALAAPLARALAHAHALGVVHRDIKPANVFVTDHDEVKLIDFGLAKSLKGAPSNRITVAGEMVGTPAYMPPEQLGDSIGVDGRADIYALGATLYHALSGKPPFAERNPLKLRETMGAGPVPLSKLVPGVPASVRTIVERAMQMEPSARYQDAGALLAAIEAAAAELHVGLPVAQQAAFAGWFKEMELIELLQMVELNRKSGGLEVLAVQGGASIGTMRIVDGRILEARAGERAGEVAIRHLLAFPAGYFQFVIAAPTPTPPAKQPGASGGWPISGALMEAMRARDEGETRRKRSP